MFLDFFDKFVYKSQVLILYYIILYKGNNDRLAW